MLNWFRRILTVLFGDGSGDQVVAPPVIDTPWGPVTESARRRAALNMRDDDSLREHVEDLLIGRAGGDIRAGLEESHRRYPEAYEGDD